MLKVKASLHPGQVDLYNRINNPNTTYLLVNIGRQWGKTHFAITYLLKRLSEGDLQAYWVARFSTMGKIAFDNVLKWLDGSNLIRSKNTTRMEIFFRNGSSVKFFSAENYESIRGQSADLVICDEFAMFKKEAWEEAIQPIMISRPGSKAVFLTTPRGKNWYYNLWNAKSTTRDLTWQCVTASSETSPLVDINKLKDIKDTISEMAWRQEYLAEFVDNTDSLFENISNCIVYDRIYKTNDLVYIGIDIGFKKDYTVVVAFDKNGRMLNYWRGNDATVNYDTMVNNILDFITAYPTREIYCESNKFDSVPTLLRKRGIEVRDWVTTAQSKKAIIDSLISGFKTQQINILSDDYLVNEFRDFSYIYNVTTGNVQFGAPAGGHDDIVMASAIAYYHAQQVPKAKLVEWDWV